MGRICRYECRPHLWLSAGMSQQTKTRKAAKAAKEKDFPVRYTVRFDEDVRILGTESCKVVDWDSFNHVVNASMRQALKKFAPDGVTLCVSPFEQLVFAKRITIKRTK